MKKRGLGIFLSYGYTFLNMICSLFMSSFLLRGLGDTEYGLYQTISAFSVYLVMLEFGTGTVMSRNIAMCRAESKDDKIKNSVSTIWYITVALSLLITVVAVIFCLNLGNVYSETMTPKQVAYGQKMFVIMAVYLLVSFFTNNLNGILLGMEEYTFGGKVRIIKLILRTLLLIVLISFKPLGIIVAAVDLLVSLGVFIVTFVFCKKKYKIKFKIKYFDKEVFLNCMPLCLALLLQTVINQANNSVDKFIIGVKMSVESVALYSIAQYVYSLISTIGTIPIGMYMPQIAKEIAAGKKERELTATLVPACRLVVLCCGTVLFGFLAVGRQFVGLFYGISKQEAWMYAVITCLPMFVNMTTGVILNVVDIYNKRLVRSLILGGTTALNIVLTLLLIPYYGILGAVIGTAISLILGNVIIMSIYYKKALGIHIMWLYLQAYKGLLPAQIIAAVIAFAAAYFIKNIYVAFFAGGLIYVIIAAVMMLLFGLNVSERKKVDGLLKKLKLRKG